MDNDNDDPNHNYQILEESWIDSHNECFPTRVVQFNRKNIKYLHGYISILKSINHRNGLYKNLSSSNLTRLSTLKNNCISIDIGMSLRKRLLTPKDFNIKIFLSNTNLT